MKVKVVKMDAFDRMAHAICEYLRERNWRVAVLGNTAIRKAPGAWEHNYEFVVEITATLVPQPKRKRRG